MDKPLQKPLGSSPKKMPRCVCQVKEHTKRLRLDLQKMKKRFRLEILAMRELEQDQNFNYGHLNGQMKDHIELHKNEMENLRSGISEMNERVTYQTEENLQDIQDMIESCETRISQIEHQQQQQQLLKLEAFPAHALLAKLLNIILTVALVLYLLCATTVRFFMPFLKTRFRCLSTGLFLAAIIVTLQLLPQVLELSFNTIGYYVRTLVD